MSSGRFAGQPGPDTHTRDRDRLAVGRWGGGDHGATAGPSSPAHRGRLRGLQAHAAGVSGHIRGEMASDRVYLVPLRAFIGIGWLRAFAEKAIEPGWRDGSGVAAFLQHQLDQGQVTFPVYRILVTEIFLPHAAALGWIVMVGQLLAGLAILCGGGTSAALLGGLFMNLNFLIAGATEPSAFYIAIQALLLLMGAGAIVGVDAWLSRTVHHPLLVAQPVTRRRYPPRAPAARGAMLLALAVAGYGLAHVTDWSPRGSIHDPAVVLVVLASLGAGWSAVALLQAEFGQCPAVDREFNGGGRTYALPLWPGEPVFAMDDEPRSVHHQDWGHGGGNRPIGPSASRYTAEVQRDPEQ